MKKTKKEVNMSLNKDVIELIDKNFSNRSKFVQYCIVQELGKIKKFRIKIEKMLL